MSKIWSQFRKAAAGTLELDQFPEET